ncbi:hypothetical protein IM816_05905 [Luteibacter flocculans]|uniref:Uncharacterized protein n=1 Tax=Luteibacter flocculans TaxID=2780091 RepID=A0ABY4T4J8_9GAMM|nr:hypothetical protein [Luteibacter flocculans]URL59630.1 hypothetical protein IM816_05905 [Luteibacter flocculans]
MGIGIQVLGIQVFDAAGNLQIDVTTRLSRVIGTTVIPAGSSGAIAVPNAGQGAIWYAIYTTNGNRYTPVISVDNGVISWVPRGGFPGGPVDTTMIYGLY